jgi:hypothetical protein
MILQPQDFCGFTLSLEIDHMPLKLSISMSRKVGEPNYGSRGATVGLEMEIDTALADQPRQLHACIARLFRLAKQSVDRELACDAPKSEEPLIRSATPAQIRALYAIARRRGLDLAAELHSRFGVEQLEDLSLTQASQLIDALRFDTAIAALPQA